MNIELYLKMYFKSYENRKKITEKEIYEIINKRFIEINGNLYDIIDGEIISFKKIESAIKNL